MDLLDRTEDNAEVQTARAEMLAHPQVQALMAETSAWGDRPFKRHNDASFPIYSFSTLADFGVHADDPGMSAGIDAVMSHISPEGAFQSLVNIPKAFGGTGEDMWTWILCDTPTLLYALLGLWGAGYDPRIRRGRACAAGRGSPGGTGGRERLAMCQRSATG